MADTPEGEVTPRVTAALEHHDLRVLALAFIVDGGASLACGGRRRLIITGRTDKGQ